MKLKHTLLVLLAFAAVLLINASSMKNAPNEIPYPEGYRAWTHIKSGMVGPKSPMFNKLGGFYHIYANEKAMEGYRTGKFANGSVIAFDRLEMVENDNGQIAEGNRRLVDVMIKDTSKYDSTGGWGFEEFKGNSVTERAVMHMVKKSCFNCHSQKAQNDFVFSQFRK
ncbi:cytochrome P460 [Cytophagales bacterium WSM2-2]|nr:cytochrome P460 [Cytophagales bacterium WSM2-2]